MRVAAYRVLFDEDATATLAIYIGKRGTNAYSDELAMNAQLIPMPNGEELAILPRLDYEPRNFRRCTLVTIGR
jgi:hypothetical protein